MIKHINVLYKKKNNNNLIKKSKKCEKNSRKAK